MTKLIFIRHGQSESNIAETFTGQGQAALTARGEAQAVCVAKYLQQFEVDAIYASDLTRALQTAQPFAELSHLPIIPDKGLREIYAGEWEGVTFRALQEDHAAAYSAWMHDLENCACPGGESIKDLYERTKAATEAIAAANPDKTVCIFTHAGPLRVLKCLWLGLPLSEIMSFTWAPNASTTVVTYDLKGGYSIVIDGENSYLDPSLRTTLPKTV